MEETIIIKKQITYNEWCDWNEKEHTDKELATIQLWTGIDIDTIKSWNIDIYYSVLNIIAQRLTHEGLQFEWRGKTYVVQTDKSKWNFRQFIDCEEVVKQMGTLRAAPYIAYILSQDKYETSDTTMEMGKIWGEELDFQVINSILNFFLLRKKQLEENTKLSLQVEDQINQLVKHMENSVVDGAGITPLKVYQQAIFLNRTISSIDPSYKFSTISLSFLIKQTLKKHKENIWNGLIQLKDKLLYLYNGI